MTPISTSSRIFPRGRVARACRTAARATGLAAVLAVLLPVAACNPDPFAALTAPAAPPGGKVVGDSGTGKGTGQEEVFKQFTDIPIPNDADLDLEQSLVLGTEDGWIGRLSLDVSHPMIDMYAFYTREMPRFSWQQLTTVRARISTMTYRRGARVATITLQARTGLGAATGLDTGTIVDFTVAPANRTVIEGGGGSTARGKSTGG